MSKHPNRGDPNHNFQVAKFEIEYENVFHLKNLYKNVHWWLQDYGYSDLDGTIRGFEKETLYMELISGTGDSFHNIWWRVHREDSPYHKFYLKIDFQTLRISTIEVMHKGKKQKTNKGDVILRVEGWLMIDYKNQWKKNSILKYFDTWFTRRGYKDRLEQQKQSLWFEVYDLHDHIKRYLEIATSYEMPKAFHPEKGLPK